MSLGFAGKGETAAEQAPLDACALLRWDDEGGAGFDTAGSRTGGGGERMPPSPEAGLSQLHTQVIALENLVIALLMRAFRG